MARVVPGCANKQINKYVCQALTVTGMLPRTLLRIIQSAFCVVHERLHPWNVGWDVQVEGGASCPQNMEGADNMEGVWGDEAATVPVPDT
eukprot:8010784-Pyramimonas_sp.AAC.1